MGQIVYTIGRIKTKMLQLVQIIDIFLNNFGGKREIKSVQSRGT